MTIAEMKRSSLTALLMVSLITGGSACWAGIAATERGAKITTDRFQVDIRDSAVVSILNKFKPLRQNLWVRHEPKRAFKASLAACLCYSACLSLGYKTIS